VAERNSNGTFMKEVLNWEPSNPFNKCLAVTCKWIKEPQLNRKQAKRPVE
jgi:hypothetical protein